MGNLVKGRTVIKCDTHLEMVLEGLRDFVDNMNGQKVNFDFNRDAVQTVDCDGIKVGYKLEDHMVIMRRKVYISVEDYKLSEIPPEQMQPILAAVFKVFIIQGAEMPSIEIISPSAIKIEQNFVPMILINSNPNLVSKIGGFDGN